MNPVNVASGDPASLATNTLEDQKFESASQLQPESYPTLKSYDAEASDNDRKPNQPEERATSPQEIIKETLPNIRTWHLVIANSNVLPMSVDVVSESANPRSGTAKPSAVKKVSSKTSLLPATRKSWPSAPSPRAPGISPAKSPAGATPTRRVSQPPPAAPRSNQKVERLQPKALRATHDVTKKSIKNENGNKLETVTKTSKPRGSKVQPASKDSASSAKPKLKKVTKKSSVVPLEAKESKPFLRKGEAKESKPFLRKGSGTGSGLSPVRKGKISSQPEECVRDSVDLVQTEEKEMASLSCDPVNQVQDRDLQDLKVHEDKDSEAHVESPWICENTERFDKVPNDIDDFGMIEESTPETKVEGEPNISPSTWVEIEEYEDQSFPNNGDFSNNESLADVEPARVSSPRVRHSLSQMLLEDNSETDVIDWGNAEDPPTMVYQKDEPKGLKRLLKFARKSKTDANSTGFSSPSIFSEGEDDLEDSKILTKRSSDNLVKKATLHAKNYGRQKLSSSEVYELSAPTSIGKITAQKLQESHISTSVTTTKATRSFFSLSAFKGNKQHDAKLR